MPEEKNKKASPSTKKILVIDDDEHILMMIAQTLEVEGFQIKKSTDGRKVLTLATQYEPDLILTDLMMPGGGGYEILRGLQSDSLTRSIPVLIMTGHVLNKSTTDMLKQEPNLVGYLEKPLNIHSLLTKIHLLLNTLSKDEKMIEDINKQNSDIDQTRFNERF
jgi:CheY-like chemotaxis protein